MNSGKNYPKFVLIVLLSLFQTMSCKGPGKIMNSSVKNKITSDSPKIAFLNFSIKNDTLQQEIFVRLINKIVTEGKLKEKPRKITPAPNDLIYIVSDENSNELESNYIPNPLKQTLEYVSETGQLAKMDFQRDSAQFSLRVQLIPNAKFISLEKFTGTSSDNIKLITIDIFKND
jgi:hypothetical protein